MQSVEIGQAMQATIITDLQRVLEALVTVWSDGSRLKTSWCWKSRQLNGTSR